MKILCCVKRVPAPGAKINVTADGMDVDAAHLGFTTSPHEECGVEGAIQLKEEHGGEVTVLTLGPGDAEEQLRYAASVGADHGVLIATDGTAYDPQRTAAAIVEAVEELESAEGGDGTEDGEFDLILFGNESADAGGFQVGIRVAHALGRPIVQGIKGIEVGDESITARREIDGGFEVYELPRPAVLGVKEGLNLPRYPTMKGRLASKKIEIQSMEVDADEGGQSRVRLHRPEEQISETVILGEGPEAAAAVVDVLEELGVL
ncbi:MAG: electron transfer flavoprotein subunit beta/FixA family protein [Acidimicrobiales bacterium]|nr:electron transfer flavoprotein subunit beta/FixA family protein [Acidimicrobiales bacterium]